jgi:hypothetical protein
VNEWGMSEEQGLPGCCDRRWDLVLVWILVRSSAAAIGEMFCLCFQDLGSTRFPSRACGPSMGGFGGISARVC